MGHEEGLQPKLFYHQINFDQRVPKDQTLRKIQEKIDFDFFYGEVKDTYGDNGNVSIPPPVILKMMVLLVSPSGMVGTPRLEAKESFV
jgi:hypothetical protein